MAVTRALFKELAKDFTNNVFADFNKDFTIESFTSLPDGQGGEKITWSTFATIKGFVERLSGKEQKKDEHLQNKYPTEFSFEYVAGINNKMRIIYNGKQFNIRQDIPILEADVFINIIADEEEAT